MRRWTKRGLRVGTVAIAAGLGAAAIGYGAIPGATGAISGCYEKRTGALRVLDAEEGRTCTQREEQLVWSQRGPQGDMGPEGAQGPAGPAGAQGPAGPQGERGPSDAFVDDPGAFVEIDRRTDPRALILLNTSVPAGKFVLWAKTTYQSLHTAREHVICWLYVNGWQHDASLAMVDPDGYAALALMSPIEGPANVTVNCAATHGYFWGPRLAAVQVARVNGG